jgi:hypothetical protein
MGTVVTPEMTERPQEALFAEAASVDSGMIHDGIHGSTEICEPERIHTVESDYTLWLFNIAMENHHF